MFNETFKTAVLSTAHLAAETLKGLDALEINRELPYWIHASNYGYFVRFAAGCMDVDNPESVWFSSQPEVVQIFDALQAAGIEAALFDSDGPIIDGLPDYSQGQP